MQEETFPVRGAEKKLVEVVNSRKRSPRELVGEEHSEDYSALGCPMNDTGVGCSVSYRAAVGSESRAAVLSLESSLVLLHDAASRKVIARSHKRVGGTRGQSTHIGSLGTDQVVGHLPSNIGGLVVLLSQRS